ncbi:hypothetical protein J3486_34110 [Streptomyces sp. VRA16 Mangrove soil]|nr:hypothetical protein [Streptomyces sp. VRA16 Mangrove soil]
MAAIGTGLFTAAVTLGAAGTAEASATGTTTINSFSYDFHGVGVKVPAGCFLTHTKGDPLRSNALQTLPKYGKACARLYVNGQLRAT